MQASNRVSQGYAQPKPAMHARPRLIPVLRVVALKRSSLTYIENDDSSDTPLISMIEVLSTIARSFAFTSRIDKDSV